MSKSIKKNILINMMRIILQFIFPLISFPYASRILTPDGIGKVNFTNSIVSYFLLFAMFGVTNYGIRVAAQKRDNKYELSKFVYELLLINLISTIISYVIFFVCIFNIEELDSYKLLLVINSFSIIVNVIGIEWLYIAEENYLYITIRSFIFQTLSIIFMFCFVRTKSDYIIYALIVIFGSAGSNFFNFFHAKKYLCRVRIKDLNIFPHIKPLFIFFLNTITCNIYLMIDTTMLGFMKGDVDVGLYTAAVKISRLVVNLVQGIGIVVVPRLSYYYSTDKEKFSILLKKSFHVISLLAFPCCIGLFCLSKDILILFSGSKYLEAYRAMRVLTLLIPIIGFSNIYGNQILVVIGKEKKCLYVSICAALTNLIFNFILIPTLSYEGAAIASVISETVATTGTLFFAHKSVDFREGGTSIFKNILACLIIIPLSYIFHILFVNEILVIICVIISSVFFYYVILYFLKDDLLLEQTSLFIKRLKKKIK